MTTIARRGFIGSGALLAGCTMAPPLSRTGTDGANGFVRREGMRLTLEGRPYRFVGGNMWYAAYLGADAPYGDRAEMGAALARAADETGIGLTLLPVFYAHGGFGGGLSGDGH